MAIGILKKVFLRKKLPLLYPVPELRQYRKEENIKILILIWKFGQFREEKVPFGFIPDPTLSKGYTTAINHNRGDPIWRKMTSSLLYLRNLIKSFIKDNDRLNMNVRVEGNEYSKSKRPVECQQIK